MADVLTPSQRARCMAAIRSKDTKPEILVRRLSHALGFRFRLHVSRLPGKPDLVFPRLKSIVLVHGCFWHQHTCKDGRIPASRPEYWKTKLNRNQERDQEHLEKLERLGWRVLTIWECETRDKEQLTKRLSDFLKNI